MALTSANNYLEALINAGADAQSNLYEAVFTFRTGSPNINTSNLANSLMVRCKGFTPPAVSQREYPVKFLTASIDRPAAKVEVARNFSLQFRVDANYEVYKALLKQQGITFNAAKSFVATDIVGLEDKMFDVTINAITEALSDKSNIKTETLFKFQHCWISNIEPLKFDSANSQPLIVNIKCNYLEGHDLESMTE